MFRFAIRKVTKSELPQMILLEKHIFPKDPLETELFQEAVDKNAFSFTEHSFHFATVEDSQEEKTELFHPRVGYILLEANPIHQEVELVSMGLITSHRKMGIASQLLQNSIKEIQSMKLKLTEHQMQATADKPKLCNLDKSRNWKYFLHVCPTNADAIRLYQKHKFVTKSQEPVDVKDENYPLGIKIRMERSI